MKRYEDLDLSSPERAVTTFVDLASNGKFYEMLLVCSARAQEFLSNAFNHTNFSEFASGEYVEWQHLSQARYPLIQLLVDVDRRGQMLFDLKEVVVGATSDIVAHVEGHSAVVSAQSPLEGDLEFAMVTSPAARWRVDQVRHRGVDPTESVFAVRNAEHKGQTISFPPQADPAELAAMSCLRDLNLASPEAALQTFWIAGASARFDVQEAMFSRDMDRRVIGNLDISAFVRFPEEVPLDYEPVFEQYSHEGRPVDFDDDGNVVDAASGEIVFPAPPSPIAERTAPPEHAPGYTAFADACAGAAETGSLRFDFGVAPEVLETDHASDIATIAIFTSRTGQVSFRFARLGALWLLDGIN